MIPPDTITVSESWLDEVRSTGADVRVAVSELSSGHTASGRTAALRKLLSERGFVEGDFAFHGLTRESLAWVSVVLGCVSAPIVYIATSDLLKALGTVVGSLIVWALLRALRFGSVTAVLAVRCKDAELVGKAVDTISEFGAEVQSVDWRFDVTPTDRSEWVARAIQRAKLRAETIAQALGVRLLAVHSFCEEHATPSSTFPDIGASAASVAPRRRTGSISDSLGPSLGAQERAGVTVRIQYRVGPLPAGEPPSAP